MSKKKDLASALQAQEESETAEKGNQVVSLKAESKTYDASRKAQSKSKTREGLVTISGWFPANVRFELEELRLERSRQLGRKMTMQEIQAEAYNDLFKKYGRSELAPTHSK